MTASLLERLQQKKYPCHWPACLAMVGGSMVQKKTGSGTSTPERTTLACSPRFFPPPPSFWARRAAAAADDFDETMVSPVTVFNESVKHKLSLKNLPNRNYEMWLMNVWCSTCFSPTVRAMFPAVIEGISTCWSANGTSSRLILSLHTKRHTKWNFWHIILMILVKNWLEVNENDVHAVPVDVVDSRLWFQSTGVNPKKHQRTALLVMENLEGQSAQVVLVPPPAGGLTECE